MFDFSHSVLFGISLPYEKNAFFNCVLCPFNYAHSFTFLHKYSSHFLTIIFLLAFIISL